MNELDRDTQLTFELLRDMAKLAIERSEETEKERLESLVMELGQVKEICNNMLQKWNFFLEEEEEDIL